MLGKFAGLPALLPRQNESCSSTLKSHVQTALARRKKESTKENKTLSQKNKMSTSLNYQQANICPLFQVLYFL